jgi:hypothetical protein
VLEQGICSIAVVSVWTIVSQDDKWEFKDLKKIGLISVEGKCQSKWLKSMET